MARESDILEKASRVATRLLSDARAVQPRHERRWMPRLLSRLPAGLRFEPDGAALVLGCAWAVASMGRAHNFDVARVVDLVTGAPPRAMDDGWIGYVPTQDGWVSVALGPSENEVWRRFLSTSGMCDPHDVAARAQQWGIACLPLSPVGATAVRVSGQRRSRSLSCVRRALGLTGSTAWSGLRVLDLGVLVAAPLTCSVLKGLGAQITAVAHPSRTFSRWYGGPAQAADLFQADDRAEFVRLCAAADLVVDNFSPRVWETFGFQPVELGARLHLSMPAFPAGHPFRYYRAFGFQTEGLFGLGCSPYAKSCGPVAAPRVALMDHAVGLAGAVHCLAAVAAGRRGHFEVSHADVAGLVA